MTPTPYELRERERAQLRELYNSINVCANMKTRHVHPTVRRLASEAEVALLRLHNELFLLERE